MHDSRKEDVCLSHAIFAASPARADPRAGHGRGRPHEPAHGPRPADAAAPARGRPRLLGVPDPQAAHPPGPDAAFRSRLRPRPRRLDGQPARAATRGPRPARAHRRPGRPPGQPRRGLRARQRLPGRGLRDTTAPHHGCPRRLDGPGARHPATPPPPARREPHDPARRNRTGDLRMTPDSNGYLSHKQILVVMAGLMTGMFLAALDQSIVGTALPRITSELGGLGKLSWVVTAYLLTATASTPLWGKISDLYGRRPMFQVAIVIFLIGSTLAGFSHNIEQLIAFRAVQGLGGGGLMALALATIGDVVPPRERPRYQGYIAAVFGTSSVAGPVLGGFFADGPGWQWIFFVNLPIGAVALVVTSVALKMPHVRREHTIDYLGASVIVASVTSLLLYTAWAGPDHGWTSELGLTLLIGGLVLAALFMVIELNVTEPIIPMQLFRNTTFRGANSFRFLIGAAMFGALVFIPVCLQVVKGLTPTESGLGMLPMIMGLFTTSIGGGRRMSKTGNYKWFPVYGASVVTVAIFMLSEMHASSPYWYTGLSMFVMG